MRTGAHRTNAAYAWPQGLVPPPAGIRLVYLDLNHWIALAKAATGHRDGRRHRRALDALREVGDEVIFPLAAEHYMEMAGITDPRQRFDVAAVMEELSGFSCLMSGPTVIRLELEAALARAADTRERFPAVPLVGVGVLQAFGRAGGLRVRSKDGDRTEAARLTWPGGPAQFETWRRDAERALDRSVLRGPTDAEAPALIALDWDPTSARRTAETRAAQEREQAARLDNEPRWRRGRLRDIVAARYLALEAQPAFNEALVAHELRPSEFMPDPEAARRFTDSMPSADVRISLLTAAHRNPQTKWKSNDIFDLDALSRAVPYCDIVITERHARHVLETAEFPERTNTIVASSLDDLVAAL